MTESNERISFLIQVLSKKKLQDLVREIDPNEQLDEDVEEVCVFDCWPFIIYSSSILFFLAFRLDKNRSKIKTQ